MINSTAQSKSFEIAPWDSELITFQEGWHTDLEGTPQSPYRWSVNLDASIKIPKIPRSPLDKGLIYIELDAIPYLPKNGPGYQDVIMFIDGSLVSCLRFTVGEVKTCTGYFGSSMSQNSFSQIRFYLPQSVKPSTLGDGTDERQLGIGIKKLKIEFA